MRRERHFLSVTTRRNQIEQMMRWAIRPPTPTTPNGNRLTKPAPSPRPLACARWSRLCLRREGRQTSVTDADAESREPSTMRWQCHGADRSAGHRTEYHPTTATCWSRPSWPTTPRSGPSTMMPATASFVLDQLGGDALVYDELNRLTRRSTRTALADLGDNPRPERSTTKSSDRGEHR